MGYLCPVEPDIKQQVAELPDQPGVYRFYDRAQALIYVGKAKSLRKRVSSYFNRQSSFNRKTEKLVSEIHQIEFTITPSEFESLLLENNLIKQNQPKYNILLKDDKTFPYLCILHERFPRIISTRKYIAHQGEYFGPYSSVASMKAVLELVRQLYSIRTCSLALSEENIADRKFKVCLEYHIGNCRGPCEGLQDEASYRDEIAQARSILKGNLSIVEKVFLSRMQQAAEKLEFEKADRFKYKLELLEKFQSKSLVVNRKLTDIDVITIASTPTTAFLNYLMIQEGAIVFSKNVEVKKKLDETDEELAALVLINLRSEYKSENPEVYSNVNLAAEWVGLEVTVPQIGDKRKLVALSLKNALYARQQAEEAKAGKQSKKNEVLHILQRDLRLTTFPRVIECFDNSNLGGSSPVASMVRFVEGKPHKAGYRHFNIKTVEGPNDFASMKEIVLRRYKRILEEASEFPNLIVVDGGKGQLSSAVEALQELGLYGKIPVIGIAKRLEEIYYPHDSLPLHIHKKSPGLLLLQRIRDEAHRFAITFHRQKRSQNTFVTEIEQIPGIGKKTADKLLAHFKSIKKIREATQPELEAVVGTSAAGRLEAWRRADARSGQQTL